MAIPSFSMNYIGILLGTLAGALALQALGLKAVGGRTVKSESNFFSSVGRIQAGASGQPEVMILGSSITGRLPDRAQGFDGVANLGCDGGSAADTLRAIDEGRLPRAPMLVVEANALQVALQGESEVGEAMRRPWFRAGLRLPLVSAYARPAAFLYSPLLATRTGGFDELVDKDLEVETVPVEPPAEWADLEIGKSEMELAKELAGRIRGLRGEGSRVVVVWLPPGRPAGQPPAAWIRRMVAESGAEWWDLGQQADPGRIILTDRVHMDARSATMTLRSLLKGLDRTSDGQ